MKNVKRVVALTVAAGGAFAAGAGAANAAAHSDGAATNSPGVGSGNFVQVPVHVPVNVTGNTINGIGVLNPTFGDHSHNA
ncbi:chaplin [Mangrovactinospora gilvigrisea]|uniref:Chaplin n=1 Tax=Mangrovactinospora gilvigrisea TaxID=1428644 RepID=A0A1J7BZJ6_9ACTN|nr:chaplin [Mangrovactinospora gilvigrisea]OIV38905.1 chaplin [Mangrovactinospora gilvigrisea]